MTRPPKPKKKDFSDLKEFLKQSAAWAEVYNTWPWGGPKDEDDDYVYEVEVANNS